MTREKYFLRAFIFAVLLTLAIPFLWSEESRLFHVVLDVHLVFFTGATVIVCFLRRWWKGDPTPVTWREAGRTMFVLGVVTMMLGSILAMHGVMNQVELFANIGEVFAFLSVPIFLRSSIKKSSRG